MNLDLANLKLSVQAGLLGNAFPKLRAICVNLTENLIYTCFYIDGEISEDDKECCESILDEVHSDFCNSTHEGKEIEFETHFTRLDYPQKPLLVGHWVYYRKE
jgi:hypothetical protein